MTRVVGFIRPENSVVIVEDVSGGQTPRLEGDSLVASSGSCIAVACRSALDGETRLTMGEARDVDPGAAPSLDVLLATPGREVVIRDVSEEILAHADVATATTRVRVWMEDSRDPGWVVVGIN